MFIRVVAVGDRYDIWSPKRDIDLGLAASVIQFRADLTYAQEFLASGCLAARVIGFILFGATKLLNVVALDGLVQGELRKRIVDREPLALAAHQPRVFPLGQLLGYCHYVHFCSVFVLSVLELKHG